MIRFQAAQSVEGGLEVLPNLPNPFIEMTMLRFKLPAAAQVILRIFNAEGVEVRQKTANFQSGENHLVLQRNDLREPGIYEYQLEVVGAQSSRRKLVMF
jgi:hypothetical protein